MSQRDGFALGFLAGSLLGGIVGGVLGTVLATRINNEPLEEEAPALSETPPEAKAEKPKKRQLQASSDQTIETARRSLEDKIAQLNQTIDEVRQQLGTVNGNPGAEYGERSPKTPNNA